MTFLKRFAPIFLAKSFFASYQLTEHNIDPAESAEQPEAVANPKPSKNGT